MVKIRKAISSDAEKILSYCKLIGSETDNLTFGKEGVPITVEKEIEYLEGFYSSTRQLYLVAIDDDEEIVGTAVFSTFTKQRLSHMYTTRLKGRCAAIKGR